MFAENLKNKKERPLHFTRGMYKPAINELEIDLKTVVTNAPINEKEGDVEQAKLERKNAISFKAAIDLLKKQK